MTERHNIGYKITRTEQLPDCPVLQHGEEYGTLPAQLIHNKEYTPDTFRTVYEQLMEWIRRTNYPEWKCRCMKYCIPNIIYIDGTKTALDEAIKVEQREGKRVSIKLGRAYTSLDLDDLIRE